MKTFIATGVMLVLALAALAPNADADQEFVTIGTGGVTGVYYPTGGAICRLVNKRREDHGIRCSVESTGGSIYNLNTIRRRDLDMGVVQSDWQYHAYHGTDQFEAMGAFPELRAVFSVHAEPFTVIARADAGISQLGDLKGKRVNIGNPGSGQRATMEVVMESQGWTRKDFVLVSELKSAEQSRALCDNKIDAMVFTVGHPSGSVKEATTSCDCVVVPVTGPEIDALIAGRPYYRRALIPGGLYRGNDDDVPTFGVGATFVASTATPADTIYEVVRAVFENLDQFRALHPAFAALKAEEMVKDGLSAPLHDGALRYYREAGLTP